MTGALRRGEGGWKHLEASSVLEISPASSTKENSGNGLRNVGQQAKEKYHSSLLALSGSFVPYLWGSLPVAKTPECQGCRSQIVTGRKLGGGKEGPGETPAEAGEEKYLHRVFAGLEMFLNRSQGWADTLAQLPQLMGSKYKVMFRAADVRFVWGLGASNALELPQTGGFGSSPVFGVKTLLSRQLQKTETCGLGTPVNTT